MPWLLNEDKAIKAKFNDLFVTDVAAPTGRRVDVKFISPETELDDLTFPTVLIRYAGISRAPEREHRGPTVLPYTPEGEANPTTGRDWENKVPVPNWDTTQDFNPTYSPFFVKEHPVPYNIDYQIEVWSRTNAHMVSIAAQLAGLDRIPERFGFLEIPEDGTVRTLELLGGPTTMESTRDAAGKRLFRLGYRVRVASELDVYAVEQLAKAVETVEANLITWMVEIPLEDRTPIEG